MARVLITGSSDGLGLLAGQLLVDAGHDVTLHARSAGRASDARRALPGAAGVVVGDVSTLAGMRDVAEQADAAGPYDAVIHNVGLGYRGPRIETVDGLSQLFAVNVLAPYVLTALMARPARLVYRSSGTPGGGGAPRAARGGAARRWNGSQAYSDTKL